MSDEQLNKVLLQYVKHIELNDNITEFKEKVMELGLSMDIPEDIIAEVSTVLNLYE